MSVVPTRVPTDALPRWNLDSLFPGPESPQFRAALGDATRRIDGVEALCERHGVGTRPPGRVDAELVAVFEEVVAAYDAALAQAYGLDGYLSCLTAADTRNEPARAAESEWRETKSRLAGLAPRFVAWVSALDRAALVAGSAVARDHEPVLRRLHTIAAHLMPPGEEELAALLGPSGATAWMTLSEEVMSQAAGSVEIDGEARDLPLSEIDNLAYDPDRDVRRRGHEAAQAARLAVAVPLAAALNGVKAQQLTLSRPSRLGRPPGSGAVRQRHRPGDPGRDVRGHAGGIARLPPLSAGQGPCARSPGPGRVRPAGARRASPATWPYDAACAFVVATFAAFDPKLGAFAERAFAERWIDVGPRLGKEGGRVLHRGRRRRLAHPAQLPAGFGLDEHDRPRTGPRVPQLRHRPAGPHLPASVARLRPDDLPVDPGRNRQHALRDPGAARRNGDRGGRGIRSPASTSGCSLHAQHLRHHADVRVRARRVRGQGGAGAGAGGD